MAIGWKPLARATEHLAAIMGSIPGGNQDALHEAVVAVLEELLEIPSSEMSSDPDAAKITSEIKAVVNRLRDAAPLSQTPPVSSTSTKKS